MKTPRTDQLLELISANKLGYRSAFEEAIELCESLETELSNRQPNIVKPITKSVSLIEQAQLYMKQFEFQKAYATMSQLISSLTDNQNADIVKPVTKSDEEPTHTPGPWFYSSGAFYSESQLDPDNPRYVKREENPIAEMLDGNDHDARLIAAAPSLLEALEGVVRVADRATQEFDAARAAIKYAKGETK